MNYKKIEQEIKKSLISAFNVDNLPEDIIFVGEGDEVVFDSAGNTFKVDDLEFGLVIAYESNQECNFLINFGEVSDLYKVFRPINRFNCYTPYDLKAFVDDDNLLMISSVYNSISDKDISRTITDFIEKVTDVEIIGFIKDIIKSMK